MHSSFAPSKVAARRWAARNSRHAQARDSLGYIEDINLADSQEISGDLRGTFDLKHLGHMLIQLPGAPYNQTEDILYMSRKQRCAVIKIRSTLQGSPATYDLRVRNSSITRGPSRGCKRKFRRYSRGSHGTYQTTCQEILRNITQPLSTIAAKANPQSQHAR
nr:uncharacterized protein LOC126534040 isoform X2 [Dermacentor andersoni]